VFIEQSYPLDVVRGKWSAEGEFHQLLVFRGAVVALSSKENKN